ncbi:SAM-dependent methyltransferase [Lewinellaceae bacterium SD302]|nr:SAM-dependent methyltransferase [Lewinellaceae bacterium SD302]
MQNDPLDTFFTAFRRALGEATFVKLTLGKSRNRDTPKLKNIYVRPVELKGEVQLQFTYRYEKRDEVKNLAPAAAIDVLREPLGSDFLTADLYTLTEQVSVQISRKGKARIHSTSARHQKPAMASHNRVKLRNISAERPYLRALGITGTDGKVLAAGQNKFKQINKFVEIIDGLVNRHNLPTEAEIVDMGSGKGYLTFALYDHLANNLGLKVKVTGVEIRPDLVEKCNRIARENELTGLSFVEGYIDNFKPVRLDMLIALHACDTATDDALFHGIRAGAEIMVVAPCCQKQVRKDLDPTPQLRPLLKHGILLERQAAMLTDALRSLYLEREGYQTKVFEFIALEHTAKNVMITAVKGQPRAAAETEIKNLMHEFGLKKHYLGEKLSGA